MFSINIDFIQFQQSLVTQYILSPPKQQIINILSYLPTPLQSFFKTYIFFLPLIDLPTSFTTIFVNEYL